jgi:hypothetical protein
MIVRTTLRALVFLAGALVALIGWTAFNYRDYPTLAACAVLALACWHASLFNGLSQ